MPIGSSEAKAVNARWHAQRAETKKRKIDELHEDPRMAKAREAEVRKAEARVEAERMKTIREEAKERAKRQKQAESASEELHKRIGIITAFKENKVLGPIVKARCSPKMLAGVPKTIAQADDIIAHIRSKLNSEGAKEGIVNAGKYLCDLVESITDHGDTFGKDWHGLSAGMARQQDKIEKELNEIECLYGGMFQTPWWMRLGYKMWEMSENVDRMNRRTHAPAVPLRHPPATN